MVVCIAVSKTQRQQLIFAEKLSTEGRRPRLCRVLFSAKMCFLYVIATKTSIAEGLYNKIIGKEKLVLENVLQWEKGFLNETQFEEAISAYVRKKCI